MKDSVVTMQRRAVSGSFSAKKAVMRLCAGITYQVGDPDRNCQVETTEKLIHADLLALHVTRNSTEAKYDTND